MPTILVIEDEDAVRDMLKATLERNGFRVFTASGGREALDLCEAEPDPFDVLLTDIVMPGTSGIDLAGYLAVRYPTMRVVRMSGFTEAMLGESGLRRDDSLFLQKPFSREQLLATIRMALEGPNREF
jgi:DNA-binding NtrC family response regulator